MTLPPAPRWDLDRPFPGGPTGPAWRAEADALEAAVAALTLRADALGPLGEDTDWPPFIAEAFAVEARAADWGTVAHCAASAAALDPALRAAAARADGLTTRLERAWTAPRGQLGRAPQSAFDALCADPLVAPHAPSLRNQRAAAALLLPPDQQLLFAELAEPALHAWGRLYDDVSAAVVIEVDGQRLSQGQAFNRFDDPDPAARGRAFDAVAAGWAPASGTCAAALAQICGTRSVLARRTQTSPLAPALAQNRVEAGTIDAMWAFARELAPALRRYLRAKGRALGLPGLRWADLRAPVGQPAADGPLPFPVGVDEVVRLFAERSPAMAALARQAAEGAWIEAEDRPGKRHGAFCAGITSLEESRVFMTWSGSATNLTTLAHELGHAFHNEALRGLPLSRRELPMTLAETASTFGEALVRQAALAAARSPAEELHLLDLELQAAAAFLLNIPVRYDFERALLSDAPPEFTVEALSAAMESAQRDWYGDGLTQLHPLFWAEKLHFYLTRTPFYNFPYTFGYLFSARVAAAAADAGPGFDPRWIALLRATGTDGCEQVAAEHLGLDLRSPGAWAPVGAAIEAQVARFEALAGA